MTRDVTASRAYAVDLFADVPKAEHSRVSTPPRGDMLECFDLRYHHCERSAYLQVILVLATGTPLSTLYHNRKEDRKRDGFGRSVNLWETKSSQQLFVDSHMQAG